MSYVATQYPFRPTTARPTNLLPVTTEWNLKWQALTDYLLRLEESAHRQAANEKKNGRSPEISQSMGILCHNLRLDMESFESVPHGHAASYSSHALRMLSASWHVESIGRSFDHGHNSVGEMSYGTTSSPSTRSVQRDRPKRPRPNDTGIRSRAESIAFNARHGPMQGRQDSGVSSQTEFTDLDRMVNLTPRTPQPCSPWQSYFWQDNKGHC